jgi:hypothetical protein
MIVFKIFKIILFFTKKENIKMSAIPIRSLVISAAFLLTVFVPIKAQNEKLIYHNIRTDAAGNILPWFDDDPGKSYSHIIQSLWSFWDTMRIDMNGLPYYMNHQVWNPGVNDPRGIGGDQLQMALSSWRLLYAYTGNERIKENMKFMADYYLSHSLSSTIAKWPAIPYPYNTLLYSGLYDGDMVIGKNFTQPDKAGSFGYELIQMYKLVGLRGHGQSAMANYLNAAIDIANTLAKNIKKGNENQSPWPFKVNALTGETGSLVENRRNSKLVIKSDYTTNWSGALELFLSLIDLKKGDTVAYKRAFTSVLNWMKKYPLINNKWGPFFEDIPGWSDTQINAVTFAQFMMHHPEYFPDWKTQVKNIFNWVYKTVGNDTWKKYGVIVVNEQTAYQTPGNSHTARQACAELQYAKLTGDTSYMSNAVRALNWATYMVDVDGKNRYPQDENWLTDGYGDYVRHYLLSMSAMPALVPKDENHIISSTSVIQYAEYKNSPHKKFRFDPNGEKNIALEYTTFDEVGKEVIHLTKKPSSVFFYNKKAMENPKSNEQGYQWKPTENGDGFLYIIRVKSNTVTIID